MSISENIAKICSSIASAAKQSGRDGKEITLVAVCKHASVLQMQEAYEAGIRNFGLSRWQDAQDKMKSLPENVIWHFIGRIQSNKASKIASFFNVIHSIDSMNTAELVSEKLVALNKQLPCFIQVNVGEESSKQGFSPSTDFSIWENIHSLPGLQIIGLMTIPPRSKEESKTRKYFQALKRIQEQMQSKGFSCPYLSMGMSDDYGLAILDGATHVRIGSAIFEK